MNPLAAHQLQTAIYDALTTDTDILAALGGPAIYDAVPQATPMPYVAFGAIQAREPVADTNEYAVTLEVWSRGGGHREAHAIAGSVIARLHDGALTITGARLINIELEFVDTRREPDPDVYRATLRFRIVTEPDL